MDGMLCLLSKSTCRGACCTLSALLFGALLSACTSTSTSTYHVGAIGNGQQHLERAPLRPNHQVAGARVFVALHHHMRSTQLPGSRLRTQE